MEPVGLYIHIPFCVQKCRYCDFYSLPLDAAGGEAMLDAYLSALCAELSAYRKLYGPFPVDTVYFGGGTPSLMREKRLRRLMEEISRFSLCPDMEVTLEANPETVNLPLLAGCRTAGFTRVSFGVQSGVEKELRALGRIHSFDKVKAAFDLAIRAGFPHLSADLMIGIPYQTTASLKESIFRTAALGPDHISAYLLSLEEGTPLWQQRETLPMLEGDALADAYLDAVHTLEELGFRQYEISNFAKDGGESRHNLKYWKLKPYLGVGPGAHSYFDGRRFYYPRDLKVFLSHAGRGPINTLPEECDFSEETVMLGLRLAEGLPFSRFDKFAKSVYDACEPLRRAGLAVPDRERLRLSAKGFLMSNAVIGFVLGLLDGSVNP